MANGFALRGFTQGFTQGLQNVDQLFTNWQNRDMQKQELALQRQQQDRTNRYNDALIRNQERDNERADIKQKQDAETARLTQMEKQMELDDKQRTRDLTRLYGSISSGTLDDDTTALARKYGIANLATLDTSQATRLADDLESGRVQPNDPAVMKVLAPVFKPAVTRAIGAEGVVPGTAYRDGSQPGQAAAGTRFTVATKDLTGMDLVNGRWVPRLRVQGADQQGNFVAYDAPFTQNASSDPADPLVSFSPADIAGKLRSAASISGQLASNPELRQRMLRAVQQQVTPLPKEMSLKDQSYILNQQDQVRSRQFRDGLELGKEGGSSRSSARSSKPAFDFDRAAKVAQTRFPAPPKGPDGIQTPEMEQAASEQRDYIDRVSGLVRLGGMSQDDAEAAANRPSQLQLTDRGTFWVVQSFDSKGRKVLIPYAQVQ